MDLEVSREGRRLTGAPISDGGIFDKTSGNDGAITGNPKRDARESGSAGENITALRGTIIGAWNIVVVVVDYTVWEVKESGTGVGNSFDGSGTEAVCPDGVTVASESPEASTVVNGHIRNTSGALGVVNESKAIASRRTFLQIHGEEGGGQAGLCIVKKGRLLDRAHCEKKLSVLFHKNSTNRERLGFLPLLMELNDKPNRPSSSVSRWN